MLVLLHGLGDTCEAFANLGRQMKLPETAVVALQGPSNLLDLPGKHWGDDIIFDSTTGVLDSDAGFQGSSKLLEATIRDALIDKCGYKPSHIMLLGFGQGGMAALDAVGK